MCYFTSYQWTTAMAHHCVWSGLQSLFLFVWDLEQLLCLFFPDNLSNSTEKRRHRLCLFFSPPPFFFSLRIEIIHVFPLWNEFPNHNTARWVYLERMLPCSMNWIVHTVGGSDSASISECKLHKKEAASFMTLMNSPSSSIREIFPRDNDSPSIFLAVKEEIVLGLWFCMKLSGGFLGWEQKSMFLWYCIG